MKFGKKKVWCLWCLWYLWCLLFGIFCSCIVDIILAVSGSIIILKILDKEKEE